MNRASLAVLLAAAVATGGYFIYREHAIREQDRRGFRVSPNTDDADLYSHSVFTIGNLFLTFDSTKTESAVWLVRSAETFVTSLFPPAVKPVNFVKLIQWKAPGRIAWLLPGAASADLLVEFDPESNHRLAVVRLNCGGGACRTTTQERGLPAAKLLVSPEEHALLLNDKNFVIYQSIADLMRDSGTTTPRLSTPGQDELVAQSRTTTLLLSNPATLSGEIIHDSSHSRVRVTIEPTGTPAGLALSESLQLVVDQGQRTHLWDCPANVFAGNAECAVYTAPKEFPHSGRVSITDDECGIGMHRSGSTWLVRRNAQTEELLRADGIVRCRPGEIAIYRARQVEYVVPGRHTVTSERRIMQLSR